MMSAAFNKNQRSASALRWGMAPAITIERV
jgi:hypothetical protein